MTGKGAAVDALPDLPTMDRNQGIGLEAQPNVLGLNLKHRDFNELSYVSGASDHHGFLVSSGQDQHDSTSSRETTTCSSDRTQVVGEGRNGLGIRACNGRRSLRPDGLAVMVIVRNSRSA
jgi:hypothetical protein